MPIHQPIPLVLASGSAIRAQMLKSVGLSFSVAPSSVDEAAIKRQMTGAVPETLALALAHAKAKAVAADYPDHFTIGADQLCVGDDGTIYDKPETHERAEAQLHSLNGRTHVQYSGICIVRGQEIVWDTVEKAALTVKALTDEEITAYIRHDQPLQSCGSYRLEGLGRHLFSRVEGDHDVIKGLPLVTLLFTLHQLGAVQLN